MGRFEKMLEKFIHAKDEIASLGSEIVKEYPNSPRLAEMSNEIKTAVEALGSLADILQSTLQDADQDEGLYQELSAKIDKSEIYSALEPADRKKLAEYLVQSKKDLAEPETLIGYVEKTLSQKSIDECVAMYPKPQIIERGKKLEKDADDFQAYQLGQMAYHEDFKNDPMESVQALAKVWLSRGLTRVVKDFYAAAFKPEAE
jgi:hypothetical protein